MMRSVFLWPALLAVSATCALPPRPVIIPRSANTATVLSISGSDAHILNLFCRHVAATGCFARIQCGEPTAKRAEGNPPLPALPDTNVARVHVQGEIRRDRSDWYTNSVRSLRYATTAARISRRSDLVLHVEASRGAESYRGLWTASGRVGVYAYLPLYTGLVGTLLGATLDRSFSAETLARRCRSGEREACNHYDDFLEDGFALHGPRLQKLLGRLGCFREEFL